MNGVHAAVLMHIRASISKDGGKAADTIQNLTDDQMVRLMFSNYRGREGNTRGMRLTQMGLSMMREYFRSYEISLAEDHRVNNSELLYLDRRAKLPYFLDASKVVVFETELGLKLKLADGDIRTLIEIEAA